MPNDKILIRLLFKENIINDLVKLLFLKWVFNLGAIKRNKAQTNYDKRNWK